MSPSGDDVAQDVLSALDARDVVSVNQLHGDGRGAVRLSLASRRAARRLDLQVAPPPTLSTDESQGRVQLVGARHASCHSCSSFVMRGRALLT